MTGASRRMEDMKAFEFEADREDLDAVLTLARDIGLSAEYYETQDMEKVTISVRPCGSARGAAIRDFVYFAKVEHGIEIGI